MLNTFSGKIPGYTLTHIFGRSPVSLKKVTNLLTGIHNFCRLLTLKHLNSFVDIIREFTSDQTPRVLKLSFLGNRSFRQFCIIFLFKFLMDVKIVQLGEERTRMYIKKVL